MKIRKILAAAAAVAVAVSTMAINAFAADSYKASLGFTDSGWTFQDWDSSVEVTGDGQYSIESTTVAGAPDLYVFVVDIQEMFKDHPEASAVLDKVEIDGSEVSFDAGKIVYGDVEEKGNFRIEIYNEYGTTKDDPGINSATAINSSLKVTFTVSGLSAAAPADAGETADAGTPAGDGNTDSQKTGNVPAVAMVSVMALAGVAAVASKKRK